MIMDQTIPDIPVISASDLASEANQPASVSEEAVASPAPAGFGDLGLHQDIAQALDDMGYFEPTPVQRAVFEPVTSGKDLLVQSRTGTGKTTAFGLPIVNRVVPAVRQPQAMILCPTRELALQVSRELSQLGKHRGVLVEAVYGGAPIAKQIASLASGVHVIVGTPGRVLDHIGRRTLDCKSIGTFVLDECDEMLSMGFLEDIERVTAQLPEKHQTLLFSATMPDEVGRYARRHMKTAETLSLSRDSVSVSDIHHAYYIVSGIARSRDLLKVIFAEQPESAIIFCNTRDETTTVARFLSKQGLDAEPLSSDLSQSDRERVLNRMKAKNLQFLCATDVAARGIDISDLSHVINFSVPEQPEVYVHRTGRTGRAGKTGTALSLVGPRELGNFRFVRLQFGIKPEERILPKDDIFVGRLKVPLPPLGAPQPPDPVQILIRGVTQTPSDLERQIFEKLVASANGKRVLAQLVAEKLNALSTRTARTSRGERSERTDRPERNTPEQGVRRWSDRDERAERDGDEPSSERRDRPRFGDSGRESGRENGMRSRGRFSDRGDRAEQTSADRRGLGAQDGGSPDGGRSWNDRQRGESMPSRADSSVGRDVAGTSGGPGASVREDRGGRSRFDREQRRERPANDRGRFNQTADMRDERGAQSDSRETRERDDRGPHSSRREAREQRDDRGVRAERQDQRDDQGVRAERQGQRDDQGVRAERHDQRDDQGMRAERQGQRDDQGMRAQRREPSEREERNRTYRSQVLANRGEIHDTLLTSAVTPLDLESLEDGDSAREAVPSNLRSSRSHRDDTVVQLSPAALRAAKDEARITPAPVSRGTRDKRPSEPTDATREFWETWAENKASGPASATPVAADEGISESNGDETVKTSRPRKRGETATGGRSRTPQKVDPKRATKKADPETAPAAKAPEPRRGKHDTAVTASAEEGQARLFVNLGKKHGVSADDLRSLFAGPIGGDRARIGSVSLRDAHAHVRVPEELADTIIASINGTQHSNQAVTVERARS